MRNDLDHRRDQVKRLLQEWPYYTCVTDIEEDNPEQRALGVEPEDGDLFIVVIQKP